MLDVECLTPDIEHPASMYSTVRFSCRLIQLLLQLGTNRFVDRGLGDLPDERADDRKDCEINRRQAERVLRRRPNRTSRGRSLLPWRAVREYRRTHDP